MASALSAARAGSAGRGAGGAGGRTVSTARGGSGARALLSGADTLRAGGVADAPLAQVFAALAAPAFLKLAR